MRIALCQKCNRETWVNEITGTDAGEYCGDCFDSVPHPEPRRNRTVKSSGMNHSDPWQENAVRAMEDDE